MVHVIGRDGSVWGVEISQSRSDEHGEGVEKFGMGRLAVEANELR